MNNKLTFPIEFINQMNELLKDESEAFFNSFNDNSQKAIHLNPLRISMKDFSEISANVYGPNLERLSYYSYGYYDNNPDSFGNNPLSHAGAIYSQDPAAMMPVSSLAPYIKEGMKILDLCSAPGGKCSQLASMLGDNGFIVANEINPSRNKILQSNIERMAYKNIVVTKLTPEELANEYQEYFDIVVVDAPCSGEGMFRKYPESIQEWSLDNVNICANRQKNILDSAIKCLSAGGYLLYSTCTYNTKEDEDIVKYLINNYSFEAIMPSDNIIQLTQGSIYKEARKFYPHKAKGEGQFFCLMKKDGERLHNTITDLGKLKKLSGKEESEIKSLIKDIIDISSLNIYKFNDQFIVVPNCETGIKLPSKGICSAFVKFGIIEKKRFIPDHQLFHVYGHLFFNQYNIDSSNEDIYKYLHGEEILGPDNLKGYGSLLFCGIPIGGFKSSNGHLKNHYPKGLRNNK